MQKKQSFKGKQRGHFKIREKYTFKFLKDTVELTAQQTKQNLHKKEVNLDRKVMRSSHKQLLPIMKSNSEVVAINRRKDSQLLGFTKKEIHNSLITSKNIYISKKMLKKQEQQVHLQTKVSKNKKQNGLQKQFDIKNRVSQIKKQGQGLLYYLSDIKRQINKVSKGMDDPNIYLAHFYQSIATFHLFNNIRVPRQPHITVNLPLQVNQDKTNLPTLIFDMDQTLLHCSQGQQGDANIVSFEIQIGRVFLKCEIRPHARQTLQRLSKTFQIGIFTAGRQSYATAMLNYLDPQNKFFSFKLFRQHCHPHKHNESPDPLNVKDLRIIKNRDLKKVILIDNSAHTYIFQPQNAIPIVSFYEDQQDTELLKLQRFLLTPQIMTSSDVRPFLKNYFRLHDYKRYMSPKQICNKLY